MRGPLVVIAVGVLLAITDHPADAQPARWRVLTRADLFLATIDAAHLGAGATTDIGSYVRLDAALGGGAARVADHTVGSGRAEVIGRFVVDPFRQGRWGPYVGAGLIARLDGGERLRGLLALTIGTELPGGPRWAHAIELGYGGGVRVGVVLRSGREGRR